jgi:hypothetical protein
MDADVQSQKPRPALDAPLDDIMRGASPVVVLNAGAKCRGLIARASEIRVSVSSSRRFSSMNSIAGNNQNRGSE